MISPDSQSRDRREKFLEYQNAGVVEYWLVDPASRNFEAYTLGPTGKFEPISPVDGEFKSIALQGLFFRKEWGWQLKLQKISVLIQQMTCLRKKRSSTRKG